MRNNYLYQNIIIIHKLSIRYKNYCNYKFTTIYLFIHYLFNFNYILNELIFKLKVIKWNLIVNKHSILFFIIIGRLGNSKASILASCFTVPTLLFVVCRHLFKKKKK